MPEPSESAGYDGDVPITRVLAHYGFLPPTAYSPTRRTAHPSTPLRQSIERWASSGRLATPGRPYDEAKTLPVSTTVAARLTSLHGRAKASAGVGVAPRDPPRLAARHPARWLVPPDAEFRPPGVRGAVMSVCVHLPGASIQARAVGKVKPMAETGPTRRSCVAARSTISPPRCTTPVPVRVRWPARWWVCFPRCCEVIGHEPRMLAEQTATPLRYLTQRQTDRGRSSHGAPRHLAPLRPLTGLTPRVSANTGWLRGTAGLAQLSAHQMRWERQANGTPTPSRLSS